MENIIIINPRITRVPGAKSTLRVIGRNALSEGICHATYKAVVGADWSAEEIHFPKVSGHVQRRSTGVPFTKFWTNQGKEAAKTSIRGDPQSVLDER